jgi:hypothetical protein
MYNTIEKKDLEFFFSSNEEINCFGSRRFWWVGRKGETNLLVIQKTLLFTGNVQHVQFNRFSSKNDHQNT